jgi:hypothetical protein
MWTLLIIFSHFITLLWQAYGVDWVYPQIFRFLSNLNYQLEEPDFICLIEKTTASQSDHMLDNEGWGCQEIE